MNTIEEILNGFDLLDKRKFGEHDITSALSELSNEQKERFEFKYEIIAFSLVENSQEKQWGTFFGPQLTYTNGATFPALEDITSETILYWQERSMCVHNPLLKARYTGLVFDFGKKLNIKINNQFIFPAYIGSLISCVEGDYPQYCLDGLLKLKRAFLLSLKNEPVLKHIKEAFRIYESKYFEIDKPGIWGIYYRLLLDYPDKFTLQETVEIVAEIESAFDELINGESASNTNKKYDPWVIKDTGTALADYFINKDRNRAEYYLDKITESYRKVFNTITPLQQSMWLDTLCRMYRYYRFKEKADAITTEINAMSSVVRDSLQENRFEYTIPTERLQATADFISKGTIDEVFQKFTLYFIPSKEEAEKGAKTMAEKAPLYAMVSTQQLDYKGRPKAVIGSYENDVPGHTIQYMCQSLAFNRPILEYVIDYLITQRLFTEESIIEFLNGSAIIDNDRIPIIKHALHAYMSKDYLTAISLWIPQIENSIRELVEQSGGQTLIYKEHNAGYQLKTFEGILREQSVIDCFNEDTAYYFRVLFTDQRGENLRNDISHGLAPMAVFCRSNADRVLHALLILGMVKLA